MKKQTKKLIEHFNNQKIIFFLSEVKGGASYQAGNADNNGCCLIFRDSGHFRWDYIGLECDKSEHGMCY